MARKFDLGYPGDNTYAPSGRRVLTGDRKILKINEARQLVDVQYALPGFYLVEGVAAESVTWRLTVGIDRVTFRTVEVSGDFFGMVVSASSVSLTAVNSSATDDQPVSALIVPVQITTMDAIQQFVDRAYLYQEQFGPPLGLRPGIAIAPVIPILINSGTAVVAQSATDVDFPLGTRIVQNDASSTATLYLALGDTATVGQYSVAIVPGAYYELPDWAVDAEVTVNGIWGSAGAGFASVTIRQVA